MAKHAASGESVRAKHAATCAHAAGAKPTTKRWIVAGASAALIVATVALGGAAALSQHASYQEGLVGSLSMEAVSHWLDDIAIPDNVATDRVVVVAEAGESIEDAVMISTTAEERLAAVEPYTPTAADLAALSDRPEPFAFSANAESGTLAPALTEQTLDKLTAALEPFDAAGWQTGFILMDLGTGRGIAANLDARAYGASSIKGPYATYVCETLLDAGRATKATMCPEGAALGDMDGPYLSDGASAYPLGTLVEDSIVLSDNDSYRILRANFDAEFGQWLTKTGFPTELNDNWFPTYSARESALLWLHTASYLAGDGESAAWLSSLLEQTETSFLRDALAEQDVVVRDKAGWYADGDPAYCGTSDAGIVEKGGRDYLLCVMSAAPYSEANAAALENVVATTFAAREDLA